MAVVAAQYLMDVLWRQELGTVDLAPGVESTFYEDQSAPYGRVAGPTEAFVGSAAVNNLPIGLLPAQALPTALRYRSFLDDYYFRIHVLPSRIDLGNLLSSQTRQIEVWNSHFDPKLLSSIDEEGVDGIALAEPAPAPTTFAALEHRIYELSISTNGAPVIDGSFTFNFPGESPVLAVTGRRVVVWPFIPQTRFREQLQWLTDVMETYNGEQRLALRTAPRQALSYEFQLDPHQFSRAKAISTQWAHRVYGVPIWADATRLGALAAGTTVINVSTSNADYRSNDIVLIWESDEKLEAVETLQVTTSSVELKLPLPQSFTNAYIMPMRFARTLNGSEFSRDAFDVTRARLTFLVSNNVDLGAGPSPFPQYRGVDVLTERSVLLSDMRERILRPVDIFDNGSGPIVTDQLRGYPVRAESLTWDALDRAASWTMRKWLHARRGKQKSFWLPSWNNDLVVLNNIGSSAVGITVRPIGYPLYYSQQDIMVLLNNGTMYFNKVTSGAVDPNGNEVLTLAAAFGVAINTADIKMVSFMKHVRLDSDTADLTHGYNGRTSVSLPVVECPEGA